MSYPFPGMNPWLENPAVWKGIHQRLITALADVLAPQLEPRYFVGIDLYAFGLRKPIPTFPLPLLAGDQEPLIDLGSILHELYERARYRLIIDYTKPPVPTLTEADAAWATTCLTVSQRQESQTHEA